MEQEFAHYLESGSLSISGFLLTNFKQLGLTAVELVLVLELQYQRQQQVFFPSAGSLAEITGLSEQTVYDELHQLVLKKIIAITRKYDRDEYSLRPLSKKISELLKQQVDVDEVTTTSAPATENRTNQRQTTVQMISKEFGRMLSPIELETITSWFDQDHYGNDLIQLALREAVLNQVYNLRYMDRILLNWHKANLQTAAQVEQYQQHRSNREMNANDGQQQPPQIPLFKIDKN
ncbi:DnaD domain-containing protein [Fructilactobacillus florum]|uniref:Uncharacterized protein n=1 Tax=Fructilactobacillus florum DSM 22689 = JCM 16035 TaxID=1423745 RepID=A0A0R2CUE6_9LACO|nr:DnaD domain protein [Fructilactobacillus florum]KRM91753.1 hypothetical protein FC87_GL000577 [Fructilactobacillus florum DSM 22689 = JCM 16035]